MGGMDEKSDSEDEARSASFPAEMLVHRGP